MQVHMDSALLSVPVTKAIFFKAVLWTTNLATKSRVLLAWFFPNKQNNFLYSLRYFMSSVFYSYSTSSFLSGWQPGMPQAAIRATVSISFSVSGRQGKTIQALVHETPSAFLNLRLLSAASSSFTLLTHNTLQVYQELGEDLDAAKGACRNKEIQSRTCSYHQLYLY